MLAVAETPGLPAHLLINYRAGVHAALLLDALLI
jgi:hypothetical protein